MQGRATHHSEPNEGGNSTYTPPYVHAEAAFPTTRSATGSPTVVRLPPVSSLAHSEAPQVQTPSDRGEDPLLEISPRLEIHRELDLPAPIIPQEAVVSAPSLAPEASDSYGPDEADKITTHPAPEARGVPEAGLGDIQLEVPLAVQDSPVPPDLNASPEFVQPPSAQPTLKRANTNRGASSLVEVHDKELEKVAAAIAEKEAEQTGEVQSRTQPRGVNPRTQPFQQGNLVGFGRLQMGSEFETSEFCRVEGFTGADIVGPADPSGLPTQADKRKADVMRYVAERVWELKRPDLLVSVTGGALDFSLNADHEHELLTGLIAASKAMNVWFTSGGSDSGIMKYVGEARQKYAAHVPLIGIAPWGIVNGKSQFYRDSQDGDPEADSLQYKKAKEVEQRGAAALVEAFAAAHSPPLENRGDAKKRMGPALDFLGLQKNLEGFEKQKEACMDTYAQGQKEAEERMVQHRKKLEEELEKKKTDKKLTEDAKILERVLAEKQTKFEDIAADNSPGLANMNPYHTHFFFIDHGNAKSGFGTEIKMRSLFESAVTHGYFSKHDFERKMHDKLSAKAGSRGAETSKSGEVRQLKNEMRAEYEAAGRDDVNTPSVCICVQGGIGTVTTVKEASHDTPVFLVKGSGNCADLCSDLVILQAKKGTPLHMPAARMERKMRRLKEHLASYGTKGTAPDYGVIATQCRSLEGARRQELLDVFEKYFPNVKLDNDKGIADAVKTMGFALEAAHSQMCWVYDLNDDALSKLDFSGAMLRCVINGSKRIDQHKLANKEKEAGAAFSKEKELFKLHMEYCLQWQRPDILSHVIEHTKLVPTGPDYKDALNSMVQPALMADSVRALKVLLHFKASISHYQLPFYFGQVSPEDAPATAAWWRELLSLYYEHRGRTRRGQREPETEAEQEDQWTFESVAFPEGLKQAKAAQRVAEDFTELEKLVRMFEGDVRELLGPKCLYRMGRNGPYYDLLMWSVMMSRKELSDFLWKHCSKPIQSALAACILYRKMAQQSGLEPKLQRRLKEGGDLFERYAVGVVKLAAEQNLTQAMDALEEDIPMWEHITAVDVAIEGGCEEFIEECCEEAIVRRLRGDIDAYSQKMGPVEGFLSVVFFNCLTLGLLAPLFVNFNPPPLSENVRFASQRRSVPDGYPFDCAASEPHEAYIDQAKTKIKEGGQRRHKRRQLEKQDSTANLKAPPKSRMMWRRGSLPEVGSGKKESKLLKDDEISSVVQSLLMDPRNGREMGPGEINLLWSPTFSYLDRLFLFWRSPIVLFMANSIVQTTLTIIFTWWIVNTPPSTEKIQTFEYVMLVYFSAYLWVEFFQMIFSGLDYFLEFWNQLDMLATGAFMAGFIMRNEHGNAFGTLWRDSVRLENLWLTFYSITCFGLWCRLLRVLSVERQLGILVITIQTMFVDILRFGVIWVFLWFAFAILMRGAALQEDRWYFDFETCGEDPAADAARRASRAEDAQGSVEKEGLQCWPSWWMLRLFFQSMGEFFLEDLETDWEVISLMAMFVVMNVLLLNLLIAMMSNTFTVIQAEANRKYLFEMYELSREVSRVALAIPVPLNIPSVIVELANFTLLETSKRSPVVYALSSLMARMEMHFGRNISTIASKGRFETSVYNKYLDAKKGYKDMKGSVEKLEQWFEKIPQKTKKELRRRRRYQDEYGSLRDAFVERCREEFIQEFAEDQGKEDEVRHLETKILKSIEDVEDRVMGRLVTLPTLSAGSREPNPASRIAAAPWLRVRGRVSASSSERRGAKGPGPDLPDEVAYKLKGPGEEEEEEEDEARA